MLIGKTANCLLGAYVIAHSAVLKTLDEFVRMREITRSVKFALKCLIAVVLVDDDFLYWTSNVEHLVVFTAIFSNMRRNGYLWIISVFKQRRPNYDTVCWNFRSCPYYIPHKINFHSSSLPFMLFHISSS